MRLKNILIVGDYVKVGNRVLGRRAADTLVDWGKRVITKAAEQRHIELMTNKII